MVRRHPARWSRAGRHGPGRLVLVAAAALVLGGCSVLGDQLGLGKQSPDEYTVVTRAPLALPPDYSLRPPDPGTQRPQELTVQQRAKEALMRGSGSGDAAPAKEFSPGETAVLARAGTARAQTDIRQVLNAENSLFDANPSFVDALIFWQKKEPGGSVVDPAKEAQRIQEAVALGKSPTEGETATIERRKKGFLEGIF